MTYLPPGVTRITFDANGVPRIRDTGTAVWEIVCQLSNGRFPNQLLDESSLLQPEDFAEVTLYRIGELQEFMRFLGHDALSQVNSIYGFADIASRGMIEQSEEHDLITNVFFVSGRTLMNLFTFGGYILNGTSVQFASMDGYRFPIKIREFVHQVSKLTGQHCELVINTSEDDRAVDLMVLSDEGLQAALSELFKLSWFSKRFDSDCQITTTLSSDNLLSMLCQRRLKQVTSPSFLTDWSLSPVPLAAYALEQRGGSLTVEYDGQDVSFSVRLPLYTPQGA